MYLFLVDRTGLILSSGRDLSYFSRNVHSLVVDEEKLLNSSEDRILQIYNRNAEIKVQTLGTADEARERLASLLKHFKLEEPTMAKRNQNAETQTETQTEGGEAAVAKTSSPRTPKSAVIRLKTDKNPKREGSAAHKRFALYADGQTVDDFLKAGGTMGDINFDVAKGFIALEGVDAPAEAAPAETPAAAE